MWGGSRAGWKRRFSCYGPWEAAESCVVHTSASVYRRLQESPRGALSPPRCDSEDSGLDMGSTEHSPSPPAGSESRFPLDGLAPERTPVTEPPRRPAQRSRRQRVLGRGHRGAVKPLREPEEPAPEPPGGAEPGQGLRYLEHVCQMLERLAKLQQDNRLLRQQAGGARSSRPDTTHSRDAAGRKGERFRPRSCSDSQAAAPDAAPCRRTWGYSASSPSLLDPTDSAAAAPALDKDGRSHWGRVKELLTRLTRRSLRGGRCR
ncbi:uncharacterized protein C8orf58 homolog [Melopsittacus undulatus]|uniref:uncharacterized protein C8orf58 homolog n=1 Tax=Melopsittacus undulatus TaxID=13146 RepID=UPI00146F91EA|nr:uncharacterized protein C8orf58 homolog [Melopsittacus undulatus]